MTDHHAADRAAVRDVVDRFFAAFVSGPAVHDGAAVLREVLLPQAVIVRTCGDTLVYDVEGFIAPRVALLATGDLEDFAEWVTSARIDVAGDVAQVWCTYAKAWTQAGVEHTGRGAKSAQLVRTSDGWRISAVAWDDERPGVTLPTL